MKGFDPLQIVNIVHWPLVENLGHMWEELRLNVSFIIKCQIMSDALSKQ